MIADLAIPGMSETPPEQRRRKIKWALPAVAVIALLAWAFPSMLDYIATEQVTRRTKEVEEELDREGPAFATSVREDADAIYFAYVLDKPLNPAEKAVFMRKDGGDVIPYLESLLTSHGGQGLQLPSIPESDGYTSAWLMDFFSDRASGLAITALRGREIECEPAAAKTVVLIHPEGGGAYDGIHFDLSDPEVPVSLAPDENIGKPYFSHKKIDLGNGATPGGLYVEVSSGIKDCEMSFEAEYRDAEGVRKQRIRNAKEKFRIRGIPAYPDQFFAVTQRVLDCRAMQRSSEDCPALPLKAGTDLIY
ncbi:hypothetical protein [Streptomyces liangshanensis]|uniref:Uncharacterized protein n=1 Tax=Streptomyces liangshanensis TaxID=2717324 RepID=A0A6G9H390_9ACTN|nr:hypothetical protein [Streptomyces liangshanensis]QIQ05002.1 hypothetical protein HA039_24435 [Streptomyces liangshanensis]